MKVSVIALQLVGTTFVLASSKDCTSVALNAIPSCAQPCYLENAGKISCDGLDFACQCKQKTAMFEAIQGCVASKCPEAMFEKVIDGSNEVCDCAAPGATQPTPSPKPTPTTLKTVHNTVASSIPVSSIRVSSIQSAIAAPTNAGEGDWDYPPRPSPTYFAKSSGAERSSTPLGLSVLLSAILAFMVL